MKPKPLLKGNNATGLTLLLHSILMVIFLFYLSCVRFPVILWDNGFSFNAELLSSIKPFLFTAMRLPVLLCVLNLCIVSIANTQYLKYVYQSKKKYSHVEQYFQQSYPEQFQKAVSAETRKKIIRLQKNAEKLDTRKISAVFSNLRKCQRMELEFQELNQQCCAYRAYHQQRKYAQDLKNEYMTYMQYTHAEVSGKNKEKACTAMLLNQYYPEDIQKVISALNDYLEGKYHGNIKSLPSDVYYPFIKLSYQLQKNAEYLNHSYAEIIKANVSIASIDIPEKSETLYNEAMRARKKGVPNNLQNRETFLSQQYHSIYLLYHYITHTEKQILDQLLDYYQTVYHAYCMYFSENTESLQVFQLTYEKLAEAVKNEKFIWHLQYLHGENQDLHNDQNNLQYQLDTIRSCIDEIKQTVRKEEFVS